jgi:transcriptional regulator GlxA family with amidase domain
MKANLHRDIRLIDVARAVYLSPSYFSTLFKEYTGYTFSIYLMKVRIDAAKSLLSDTDLAIKEIVKKVGFEDLIISTGYSKGWRVSLQPSSGLCFVRLLLENLQKERIIIQLQLSYPVVQ